MLQPPINRSSIFLKVFMLNNFWGKLATLNDTSHNSTYLVYPKKRILLNNTLTEHCIFSSSSTFARGKE